MEREHAYIKEGKVFRIGFRDFPDKQIGEVRTDAPAAFAYFESRFQFLEKKVESLETEVEEAENKGSYLMRLVHLKDNLSAFDAIGDFESLYVRLEQLEKELRALIAANRVSNLHIKQAIVEEAEAYAGSTNWKEDTEKMKELKSRWIKTGNVAPAYEEDLNRRFSAIVDVFFAQKQAHYRLKFQQAQSKLPQLRQIIYKAKKTIGLPSDEARKVLKSLQEDWKKVGKVPGQPGQALSKEFQRICNNAFRQRERKEVDVSMVLKERGQMVEEVEGLSRLHTLTKENVDRLTALQRKWKQLPFVTDEKNKVLTRSFYNAGNLVMERYAVIGMAKEKFPFLEDMDREQQLKIKIDLTKELLAQDEKVLESLQSNSGGLEKNQANKFSDPRISKQFRKVFAKKRLLNDLQGELRKNKSIY